MKNGAVRDARPSGSLTRVAVAIAFTTIVVAIVQKPFTATLPASRVGLDTGVTAATPMSGRLRGTDTNLANTGLGALSLSQPTTSVTATSTYLKIRRFAPMYMAHRVSYTRAMALALAKNFDLVVAHAGDLNQYVAEMKTVNPHLLLLAYVNATFTPFGTYNSAWYARNVSGHLINAIPFPTTYLMNVANPSWPTAAAKRCSDALVSSGYDGCFLDVLGPAGVNTAYVSSLPVDPMTGKVWTAAAYVAEASLIPKQVRSSLPGVPLIANGLVSGAPYFDPAAGPTSTMLPYVDSGMAECWVRARSMSFTQYRTVAKWLDDVNMIAAAESGGHSVAVTVKLWGSPTAAQVSSWHTFSLASFLLATSGLSYYSFSTGNLPGDLAGNSTLERINIGTPLSVYGPLAGVYGRKFSAGMVLVNPSATTSVAIPLGANYTTLGGALVTSIRLKPHTGIILALFP